MIEELKNTEGMQLKATKIRRQLKEKNINYEVFLVILWFQGLDS